MCTAYAAGCSCLGGIINIACTGLPFGFFRPPGLRYTGICRDGGTDCSGDYPCLTTTSCSTDTDCSPLGATCNPCTHTCWCDPDAGACSCGGDAGTD
jgi:hypothetical protein